MNNNEDIKILVDALIKQNELIKEQCKITNETFIKANEISNKTVRISIFLFFIIIIAILIFLIFCGIIG